MRLLKLSLKLGLFSAIFLTNPHKKAGGEGRNRTDDAAFAEPCLTTWLPRRERAHTLNLFYRPRKFNHDSFCQAKFASLFPKFLWLENSGGRDDAGNEFGWCHIKTGIARAARRIGDANIFASAA